MPDSVGTGFICLKRRGFWYSIFCMRVSVKILMLAFGLAVGAFGVAAMLFLAAYSGGNVSKAAAESFAATETEAARQVALDLAGMCAASDLSARLEMSGADVAFQSALAAMGEISLSANDTVLPVSGADFLGEKNAKLKLLKFGAWVANPADTADVFKFGELFKGLKERFGCEFGIFVRANDSGDMVCLFATTPLLVPARNTALGVFGNDDSDSYAVLNGVYSAPADSAPYSYDPDASSPFGTSYTNTPRRGDGAYFKLERVSASGAENPAAAACAAGLQYTGLMHIGGVPMGVSFSPVTEASGRVIGAIMCASRVYALSHLEDTIAGFAFAGNGSAWVLDVSDAANPVIRVSRDKSVCGVALERDPNAPRREFLRKAAAKALKSKSGGVFADTFFAPDASGKIAAYTLFKPWNWIVGVSRDFGDVSASAKPRGAEGALLFILFAGAAGAVLSLLIVWRFAVWFEKPAKRLVEASKMICSGNFAEAGAALVAAENTGGAAHLEEYAETIRALAAASLSADSRTRFLRGSARDLAATSADALKRIARVSARADAEMASVKRAAEACKSLSGMADILDRSLSESFSDVERAVAISRECGENLDTIGRNYDIVSASAESVAAKIGGVNVGAARIAEVVTAINQVSTRTNLLSVNASVQSHGTGESGLGFGVVSRRIRELANGASMVSGNIEGAVGEIKRAVNAGVESIDAFAAAVREGAGTAAAATQSLSGLAVAMDENGQKFAQTNTGISDVRAATAAASESVSRIAAAYARAADRMSKFGEAAAALKYASDTISVGIDGIGRVADDLCRAPKEEGEES